MGGQVNCYPTQKSALEVSSAWCHPTTRQFPRLGGWVLCCTLIGWYTVLLHPSPHPSHLSLLRDVESSGAGLPHALHSPRRGRQRSSSLLEPSQSLPLWGCDTIGATCRRGCGVYPPVFCASTPGLMGGILEGLHSPRTPQGTLCSAPRPSKLDSGPAAILIPQSHLQVAGRGGWFSIPHHSHVHGEGRG